MSLYSRSPLQKFMIWLGVTVLGVPIIIFIASLLYSSFSLFAFGVGLILWLGLCVAIRALARWIGVQSTLIGAGVFLLGLPIGFLLFALANSIGLTSMLGLPGSGPQVILYWFLGFWAVLSGLSTRNQRGMYLALHIANWFFWIGIAAALALQNYGLDILLFLFLPLAISLILVGLYNPVVHILNTLPFMRRTMPKHADMETPHTSDQDYERGYQATHSAEPTDYSTIYPPDAPTQRSRHNTPQQQLQ